MEPEAGIDYQMGSKQVLRCPWSTEKNEGVGDDVAVQVGVDVACDCDQRVVVVGQGRCPSMRAEFVAE